MLTVRLHGHLADTYESEYKFQAKTIGEAIKALKANLHNFIMEIVKDDRHYQILVDADEVGEEEINYPIHSNSTIDIVPVIAGSGSSLFKIIAGIAIVALSIYTGGLAAGALQATAGLGAGTTSVAVGGVFVNATALAFASSVGIAVGGALISGGIAEMMAPDDKTTEYGGSFLGGPSNIVGQGHPIPVGYGRRMIGSTVVSTVYSSTKQVYSTANLGASNVPVYMPDYDSGGAHEGLSDYDFMFTWDNDTLEALRYNANKNMGWSTSGGVPSIISKV
jgi:predicted phage tail protein